MVKKIENEGTTILVSDSEESKLFDIESMIEDEEELFEDKPSKSKLKHKAGKKQIKVEFREFGTNCKFGGELEGYNQSIEQSGMKTLHFAIMATPSELLDFPLNQKTEVDTIDIICGKKKRSLLSQITLTLNVYNLYKRSADENDKFIYDGFCVNVTVG
jgi:hypothetical protein